MISRRILLCLMLLACAFTRAEVAIPALESRVTDLTDTLSATQRAQLEDKLRSLEDRKGSQIAILLVPTTEPETIEQYALRVAEAWKLGRKGVDDGLLILAALQDRTLRLEVGYGLEGVVPDAVAKRIISETMTPYFRQGDYYGGLAAAVDILTRVIEGDPMPAPTSQRENGGSLMNALPLIFFAVILLGGIVRAMFGQLLGASIVSTVISIAVWLLLGSLIFSLLAAVFAFIITLLGGGRNSRFGGTDIGRGGGWGGGLGGGGFSGRGGGFGGGGASGRW